jgi:hypothetical protein
MWLVVGSATLAREQWHCPAVLPTQIMVQGPPGKWLKMHTPGHSRAAESHRILVRQPVDRVYVQCEER